MGLNYSFIHITMMLICLASFIHVGLTYVVTSDHLKLLDKSQNLHVKALTFAMAFNCLFDLLYLYTPVDNQYFGIVFNIFMLTTILAKYYYFKSLQTFLKPKLPIVRWYKKLAIIYIPISLCLMIYYWNNDLSIYFDLSSPQSTGNALRDKFIPYKVSQTALLFLIPNYLFTNLAYGYLFWNAYKQRRYYIMFGIFLTFAVVLFTNSFHFHNLEFWLPLNIAADLTEVFRLHYIQKNNLKNKANEFDSEFKRINKELNALETLKEESKIVKHDVKNDLTISMLSLHKAKMLSMKADDSQILSLIEKSINAQRAAIENMSSNDTARVFSLYQMIDSLLSPFNIEYQINVPKNFEINTCEHKMKSVFLNIIKNASEVVSTLDSQWIRVNFERRENNFIVQVTDSGLYSKIIKPERIFTLDSSSKGAGRGVGLYSVKRILSSLGGIIALSETQGNTTFEIKLPNSIINEESLSQHS